MPDVRAEILFRGERVPFEQLRDRDDGSYRPRRIQRENIAPPMGGHRARNAGVRDALAGRYFRVPLFGRRATRITRGGLLGFGKQLHPQNIFERPDADRVAERRFFGDGLARHRLLHRGTDNGLVGGACRSRRRVRGLRAEHILLCIRAKAFGRGEDERLLRGLSVYRYAAFAGDFP